MTGRLSLVTGGAGFIGSHLVEALLARGDEVRVFDVHPLEGAANLEAVRGYERFSYMQGDMRDADAIRQFVSPDAQCIFHFASVVGVKHYVHDPLTLIDVGIIGTRHLLEEARKSGTRFVFASTSEVYGKSDAEEWVEDGDRLLGGTSVDRWSYGSMKAMCEHMLFALYRSENLPFTALRFFNAYGPRQAPHYVVSQSVARALQGQRPYLYDSGRQTRCFTFIEDIVRGVIAASESERAVGEVINLAHTTETSIKTVVEQILEQIDPNLTWEEFNTADRYGDTYEDVPRRRPIVRKAHDLLGWRADTSLSDGLAKTIAWAKGRDEWLREAAA